MPATVIRSLEPSGSQRPVVLLHASAVQDTPQSWTALTTIIARFDGTLVQADDALIAVWGVPQAHEDDVLRAAWAALALQDDVPDQLQITLVRGDVVVEQPMILGEALQPLLGEVQALRQLSEAVITISQSTARLIAPVFVTEVIATLPLSVYALRAAKAQPASLRGIAGLRSALVGRSREWALLQGAAQQAVAGRGNLVVITGEPGLGKSRLIEEWQSRMPQVRWVVGHCVPHGVDESYHLLRDLVRNMLVLGDAHITGAALDAALQTALGASASDVRDVLGQLLGIEPLPSQSNPLSLQLHFTAAVQALLAAAATRPLGVVLEDIHWADPASVEVAHRLIAVRELPIAWALVTRPNHDAPGWRLTSARPRSEQIEVMLNPLSPTDTRQLVENLLKIDGLPDSLRGQLLDKAEGNPLFVEELIRTLIVEDTIAQQGDHWVLQRPVETLNVPDTLQGLLLARMDRLAPDARESARIAAVIGRRFSIEVLSAVVGGTRARLNGALQALQASGLVRVVEVEPEIQYGFRHALIQDAALASLSPVARRQHHRAVGNALQRLYPQRRAELAPTLAWHFNEAGEYVQAIRYHRLAGDLAFQQYANSEAIHQYQQAFQLGRQVGMDGEERLHLARNLGRALELQGRYAEAVAHYDAVAAQAEHDQDTTLLLTALNAHATIHATYTSVQNMARGEALIQQALALAVDADDEVARVTALWNNMLMLGMRGRQSEAQIVGQEALTLARALGLAERTAFVLHDLYYSYLASQQFAQAEAVLRESQIYWRGSGNQPMLSDNLYGIGIVYFSEGRLDDALTAINESLAIAQRIHNPVGEMRGHWVRESILTMQGRFDEGLPALYEAKRLVEANQLTNFLPGGTLRLARNYLFLGLLEEAQRFCVEALSLASEDQHDVLIRLWALQAQIAVRRGDVAAAVSALAACDVEIELSNLRVSSIEVVLARQSVAAVQQSWADVIALAETPCPKMHPLDCWFSVTQVLDYRAQAEIALGNTAAAEATLQEALDAAERVGDLLQRWPVLAALGNFAAQRGDQAKAQAMRERARADVEFVLAHAGSPAAQAAYRQLPEVRALLRV